MPIESAGAPSIETNRRERDRVDRLRDKDMIRGIQAGLLGFGGPLAPLAAGALDFFSNLGGLSGPPRNQRTNQGPESERDPVRRAALAAPSGEGSAATEQLAERPRTDIAGVRGRRRRIGLLGDERSPVARRRLIGV